MARTVEIVVSSTVTVIECGDCGALFGITNDFITQRQQDHKTFYCPNGHSRYYPQENEEERLKRLLNNAESNVAHVREALAREKSSHAATKGKLTKTLNRVEKGVCPHCNRTFINVQRHMHSKHPEAAS